jgi:HEAT repeat protein
VTVTCPGCKRKLTVADSALGKIVVCPACKGKVPVEESLELMPEVEAPASGPGYVAPLSAAAQGRMCPSCGVPALPKDLLCRRCGTDLVTGARDKSLAGYQATAFKKLFAHTGWILTLVVTGAIGVGIYIGVMKFKDYAGTFDRKDPAKVVDEEKKRPRARKKPKRAASPAPAKKPEPVKVKAADDGAPSETDGSAPRTPAEKRMARFTKAVTLLQSRRLREKRMGVAQISELGPHAVPLVLEGIEQEEDLPVCLILIGVLAEISRPEAVGALVDLLADPDARVRAAAVQSLASRGPGVLAAIGGGLKSDSARARVGAIRVASALQLKDLAPEIIRLLGDKAAEVRQEAARALGGAIGSEQAVELLVARLDDTNMDVAAAASEALARRPEALARVRAQLKDLPKGSDEAQVNKLFLLAGPILASGGAAATGELAERACAQVPTPRNIERARNILAKRKVITRIEALAKARSVRGSQPPMPLIVNLCLADPDVRIKTAGLDYLRRFPTPHLPMPLVICLGHENMEFAMAAAREAMKLPGEVAKNTLRRAAKGVHIRRKLLAAGVLAQKKDPTGEAVLTLAAARELNIPSPLPGWAAYCYSFAGEKDRAEGFVATAKAQGSMLEQAFYYAAAARLGHAESRKKLLPMSTDRRIPAMARVKIIGLLGELGEGDEKKLLLQVAKGVDTEAQIAAIRALAEVRDPSVVSDLVDLIPSLVPSAAAAAKSTILSYGKEAERQLQDALARDDPRVRLGALATLAELGIKAGKPAKVAAVKMLRESGRDPTIRRHIVEALEAMTGLKSMADWGWADWAVATGVAIEDPAKLPLKRRLWSRRSRWTAAGKKDPDEKSMWLSLRVPEQWTERGDEFSDKGALGKPQVDVSFSPIDFEYWTLRYSGPKKLPYKSAEDMRNAYRRKLAVLPAGKGFVRRPGIVAVDRPVFSASGGKVAPMMLIDKPKNLTTYWLFVYKKAGNKYWIASVALSARTKDYGRYRRLFETKIARSVAVGVSKAPKEEKAAGAKVAGAKVARDAPGGPQTWEWVTFMAPAGWKRRGRDISHISALGNPRVTVMTERDPFDAELKLPMSKRLYRSAAAMRKVRHIELTHRKLGNQYIPLPSLKARTGSPFRVGKAKVAPLLVTNAETATTTYWYFIALITTDVNWYCEIRCKALTKHYPPHKQFYEKGIRDSLKLEFDKMK